MAALRPAWKQEFGWPFDVPAQALRQLLKDLDQADINFFKDRAKTASVFHKASRWTAQMKFSVRNVGKLLQFHYNRCLGRFKSSTQLFQFHIKSRRYHSRGLLRLHNPSLPIISGPTTQKERKPNSQVFILNAQGGRAVIALDTATSRTEISSMRAVLLGGGLENRRNAPLIRIDAHAYLFAAALLHQSDSIRSGR